VKLVLEARGFTEYRSALTRKQIEDRGLIVG